MTMVNPFNDPEWRPIGAYESALFPFAGVVSCRAGPAKPTDRQGYRGVTGFPSRRVVNDQH
jgi:hypothetical protein